MKGNNRPLIIALRLEVMDGEIPDRTRAGAQSPRGPDVNLDHAARRAPRSLLTFRHQNALHGKT
jgi:hypothetical protein